jgi:toluene monooxygenase electron transfer component
MLSIARAAAADPSLSQRTIRFFYGGRRPEDLCAERQLRDLAGFGRSILHVDAVSEPVAGWNGPRGFVHDVVRECLGDRIPEHEAYFAGPPPMVRAMQRMLYEAGLEPDRMHFDEFF